MVLVNRMSAGQMYKLEKEKLRQQEKAFESKKKAFAKQVESQNVKGVLPSVEERGMHSRPSFNPFSPPEREKIRDRNGLFIMRE